MIPSVLALDPGLSCTGLVLMNETDVALVRTLRPPKGLDARGKASWIVEEVANVFEAECPLVLALEEGYAQRGGGEQAVYRAASALRTAELRGRLAGLVDGTDCDLMGIRPSQAQRALTGHGGPLPREERKRRMVEWARRLYPVHRWTQDTADALGVGLAALAELRAERLTREAPDATS